MVDRIWKYPPDDTDVPLILADILLALEALNTVLGEAVLELKRIRVGVSDMTKSDLGELEDID